MSFLHFHYRLFFSYGPQRNNRISVLKEFVGLKLVYNAVNFSFLKPLISYLAQIVLMTTKSKRVMLAIRTVVAAMIVSVGVLSFPLSMANAQQSDTIMGTVASIQNGKDGKPA